MKKLKKTEVSNLKKEAGEFKKFISRGNVVDMAVGVIVGGAFGKIVTSLVNDILMPIIGIFLGGLNFSDLVVKVGNVVIAYGSFAQTIVDFLIISFSVFVMIKVVEKLKRKHVEEVNVSKKSEEVLLLEEIRDLLKKNFKESE